MTILVDENQGRSRGDIFERRGHRVLYVTELAPGTLDPAVAVMADNLDALLLTNNVKDFDTLITRGRSERAPRLRRAGLIGISCEPNVMVERLAATVDLIEAEFVLRQEFSDRRVICIVQGAGIRFMR